MQTRRLRRRTHVAWKHRLSRFSWLMPSAMDIISEILAAVDSVDATVLGSRAIVHDERRRPLMRARITTMATVHAVLNTQAAISHRHQYVGRRAGSLVSGVGETNAAYRSRVGKPLLLVVLSWHLCDHPVESI